MKKILLIILIVFYTQVSDLIAAKKDIYPWSPDIVIWGEVLEIRKAEESVFPFRLINYKVHKVCRGEYKEDEILVYNILEPVSEIALKVGDMRQLPIHKADKLLERAKELNDNRWKTEYLVMEGLTIPECLES